MPRQRTVSDEPRTQLVALRTINIIKALRGHALQGLSNQQISKAIGDTPSAVTLTLNTLVQGGLVTKTEAGRYAYSIFFLQIAQGFYDEVSRCKHRADEITARVHAGSQN